MIVTATVGKIDAAIGRFEAPILAYMEKEEADFAKDSLKKTLYNVKSSKHYAESIAGLTGVGDFVATDGPVPYDEFEEGYSKTFIHHVFKKGIEIKRELIDDSRIIDMENHAGKLMDAANRTMEKFVHAPFNNAASTSFTLAGKTFANTGADGKPLAAADHPSKTGKAPDQSNKTTYELNLQNLKLAEEMMKDFVTDIGEKSNVKPDTLLVPFELRNEAWELVQSVGKPDTADNNVNPYHNKYRVIVSDWLTDDDAWFLIDSRYMKKCLYWIDRVKLEISSKKDFNTDNWMIKGYMRYSLGWTDWRWVVCNIPA